MICRNFSVNDGMPPGVGPGEGGQGRRVAIGSARGHGRSGNGRWDGDRRTCGRSGRREKLGRVEEGVEDEGEGEWWRESTGSSGSSGSSGFSPVSQSSDGSREQEACFCGEG